MIRVFVLALSVSTIAVPACAAAPNDAPTSPVYQIIDAFNKGDSLAASAAYAPGGATIMYDIPPFLWSGPQALQRYDGALKKKFAAKGISNAHIACGTPTTELDAEGDDAYVVLPCTLTFDERGTPKRDEASLAAAVKLQDGGWKIRGWTLNHSANRGAL